MGQLCRVILTGEPPHIGIIWGLFANGLHSIVYSAQFLYSINRYSSWHSRVNCLHAYLCIRVCPGELNLIYLMLRMVLGNRFEIRNLGLDYSWPTGNTITSLLGGGWWSLTCCHRTVVKMFPGDELQWLAWKGNALAAAIAQRVERSGDGAVIKTMESEYYWCTGQRQWKVDGD